MYECYDCGESFKFYGDCPSCGSENVTLTNGNNKDIDDYEDDVFENDEEITDALTNTNYDDN